MKRTQYLKICVESTFHIIIQTTMTVYPPSSSSPRAAFHLHNFFTGLIGVLETRRKLIENPRHPLFILAPAAIELILKAFSGHMRDIRSEYRFFLNNNLVTYALWNPAEPNQEP